MVIMTSEMWSDYLVHPNFNLLQSSLRQLLQPPINWQHHIECAVLVVVL